MRNATLWRLTQLAGYTRRADVLRMRTEGPSRPAKIRLKDRIDNYPRSFRIINRDHAKQIASLNESHSPHGSEGSMLRSMRPQDGGVALTPLTRL